MKSTNNEYEFRYTVVRAEYKYILDSDYRYNCANITNQNISEIFYKLVQNGILSIKKGYPWDGATIVPDTKSVMRASLVHDCLYQMMRENGLSTQYRKDADKIFYDICRADGLNCFIACLYYFGVRALGWLYVEKTRYQVIRAVRKFRWSGIKKVFKRGT